MRRPRVSISAVMLAVLVVAVDIAALRAFDESRIDNELLGLTAIPMVSILLVAFVLVVFQLRRHGEAQPWLVGLLAGGGIGLVAMLGLVINESRGYDYLMWTLCPVKEALAPLGYGHPAALALGYASALLALGLPQVAAAAIGVAVASRYGVTLVARGRAVESASSLPASDPGAV